MSELLIVAYFWPLTWVGSIIWVWADARMLMKGLSIEERRKVSGFNTKPRDWAFWCVFMWIICFPVYLAKRGGYMRAQQKLSQEPPGEPTPTG